MSKATTSQSWSTASTEPSLQRKKPCHTKNRGNQFQQKSSARPKYCHTQTQLQAHRINYIRILFVANSKSKTSLRQLAKSEPPLKQTGMKMPFLHWFCKCLILQPSGVSCNVLKGQQSRVSNTALSLVSCFFYSSRYISIFSIKWVMKESHWHNPHFWWVTVAARCPFGFPPYTQWAVTMTSSSHRGDRGSAEQQ